MRLTVTIDGKEQMLYHAQPKQELLHGTVCQQILYGGAAGGGKSHALRWDAIMFCLQNEGLNAFLFRRTYNQLEQNHIIPIQRELPAALGRYASSKNRFEFANGSILSFNHCEHESDYTNFQGVEAHWLGFDEASLFEPIQLIELRSRLRLGAFASKIKDKQHLPRVVFTSNPGGPSHNFLKRVFMRTAPMVPFYDPTTADPANPDDKGMLSIYIPARMDDNTFLDKNYGGKFSAMSPERAKALRDGDWDTVEGAALHSLDKTRHMVKNFAPPRYWTYFCSIDWGTAKPFSVGWYCVASEDIAVHNNMHLPYTEANPKRTVIIPKGSIIRIGEWYGWSGKEDEGLRIDSTAVARGLIERETQRNYPPMDYYCGDLAMWNRIDGPSVAEKMMEASDGRIVVQKRAKDRVSHYNEVLARLAGNPFILENGKTETYPLLFIMENCAHAWRTLPNLQLDDTNPDKGPGEKQEDHVYDELCYALMSKPVLKTKKDRFDEYVEGYRAAQKESGKPADFYATGPT